MNNNIPALRLTLLSLACAGLMACGGGGGSSTPAASSATGTVNLALTDGPSDDFSHVWVTVKSIAFHTDPNSDWSAADATWKNYALPAPVTIDLAQLNNGSLNKLFQDLNLPVGTYRQIRFFLEGADTTLTNSAQATSSTNGPLQWNDQVEYKAGSNIKESPLEIATPAHGIQLNGTFNVTAGSTLNLAVDFDLEHSIVPFRHGALKFFTLKPVLHYYDLNQSGAITGVVDTASLCAGSITSSCAFNLVVKAEQLSPDGSRHVDTHATTIHADGSFTLYPLRAKDPVTGNPLKYDVLIRGRQMNTILVTGVPVTAGATPTFNATALQGSGNIGLTINSNEYTAQLATPLAPLTNGHVRFQQTLAGAGEVPYEVRFGLTDPFTGLLQNPMPLENGGIQLAAYNNGGTLNFSTVTPKEGTGNYSVSVNEALDTFYTRSSDTTLMAPVSGNATTFVPGTPTLNADVQNGTVSGTIAVTNTNRFDRGQLVIAHKGSIATVLDISSHLSNNTIPFNLSNLPAGSAATPQPGAYYYAYLRLWNTSEVLAKAARIVTVPGFIDLRRTNSAVANVTIP